MDERRPELHTPREQGAPVGAPVPQPAHPPVAPGTAERVPWWDRLEGGLTTVVRVVSAVLLLAIVLTISWQVTARYIPDLRVPRWTEEVSLIFMVWLAMLGSGLAVRAGEHLSVDIVTRQLPKRVQRWLERFVWLGFAGFGAYLVWYGWELSQRTMTQTFAATQFPVGWMYLGLPFGGALMALYSLRNVFRLPHPELDEAGGDAALGHDQAGEDEERDRQQGRRADAVGHALSDDQGRQRAHAGVDQMDRGHGQETGDAQRHRDRDP